MAAAAQMLPARDMANLQRSVFSPSTSVAMTLSAGIYRG